MVKSHRNINSILFVFIIMIGFFLACDDNQDREEQVSRCDLPSCDPGRKTVLIADDFEGSVWFSDDLQMYTIGDHIEGTIDGVLVGLTCNFPDSLKADGIRVLYSGELKESCDNPAPVFGGQEIYYLHLTKISRLSPTD